MQKKILICDRCGKETPKPDNWMVTTKEPFIYRLNIHGDTTGGYCLEDRRHYCSVTCLLAYIKDHFGKMDGLNP